MEKATGVSMSADSKAEKKDEIITTVKEIDPDAFSPRPNNDTPEPAAIEVLANQDDAVQDMVINLNGDLNHAAVTDWVDRAISSRSPQALPSPSSLAAARQQIVHTLPEDGQDADSVFHDLLAIPQAVSSAKLSTHYYGFVSGGTLPIAEAANSLVGAMDLNVMVHDPNTSVAVDYEAATLKMLLQLLDLPEEQWQGRTLTTGATGSNILALAAARDALVNKVLAHEYPGAAVTVASQGLLAACAMAGVKNVKILSQKGHSSIYKAAGVLGLGRGCVVECGLEDEPWRWDWEKVRTALSDDSTVCIAVVSCGEVDTGRYGSFGDSGDMMKLRYLIDSSRHGGWIHVDGAFGVFARALPDEAQFAIQREGVAGLEYADSIGADAHKCLNVPYDSAFLFTRRSDALTDICSNGSAAYLATAPTTGIVSPLNTSLENSRRFRALPIYAVLLNLGRSGLAKLFASQILLARAIAERIQRDYHSAFELLPRSGADESWTEQKSQIGIIVLFRAKDEQLNKVLTDRINAHRTIFVSGTSFEGRKAVRVAVAGWDIDYSDAASGDAAVVCGVLDKVLAEWKVERRTRINQEIDEKVEEINLLVENKVISEEEAQKIWMKELARIRESWGEKDKEKMEMKVVKQVIEGRFTGRIDGYDGYLTPQGSQTSQSSVKVKVEENEPFPDFDITTMMEQQDTLGEIQNAKQTQSETDMPQGKRPSLVYIEDTPFGQVSSVPASEAQAMRRAFDMGVPSYLEDRVGEDGGLDGDETGTGERVGNVERSERERESLRIKSPGPSYSPLAVHVARTPATPCSPLTMGDEEEGGDGERAWR